MTESTVPLIAPISSSANDVVSDSDSDSQPPPLERSNSVETLAESLASASLRADGETVETTWQTDNASDSQEDDQGAPPPYTATAQAALDAMVPGRGLPYVPTTILGGPAVVQPSDDVLVRLYAEATVPPLLPPYDARLAKKRCHLIARGRPAFDGDTGYGLFWQWPEVHSRVNGVSSNSHQVFEYADAYLQYYRMRASGQLKTLP
ncbi:hypothetical protein VKT23_014698 [Stygiomarasmius scandens]|uniref:Uncharacterized protein n=1 Tax=Marasmiellus scandens TaxID=2682957 RepID=A0ABR1IZT2_9AGAR